jgi:hypothetical protein
MEAVGGWKLDRALEKGTIGLVVTVVMERGGGR